MTRTIPSIVRQACEQARDQQPLQIKVICPQLIPVSRYAHVPGLWGGEVFNPRLYDLTFDNGGEAACAVAKETGCIHWIVGAGTKTAVRYSILGDKNNVVKGLPRETATKQIGGRTVIDYHFPPYPAGGGNGGHGAAVVACGSEFVFASIHGYDHIAAAEQMALDLARVGNCPK